MPVFLPCSFFKVNTVVPCRLLGITCPATAYETYQWLEFPMNALRSLSRVSLVVGLLLSASGQTCFGMAFPPVLMKQFRDSFVSVGTYNTRK